MAVTVVVARETRHAGALGVGRTRGAAFQLTWDGLARALVEEELVPHAAVVVRARTVIDAHVTHLVSFAAL